MNFQKELTFKKKIKYKSLCQFPNLKKRKKKHNTIKLKIIKINKEFPENGPTTTLHDLSHVIS